MNKIEKEVYSKIELEIRRVKKITAIAAGFTILIIGLIGIVAPVIPGILLIFVGLTLLSVQYIWARHAIKRIRSEFNNIKKSAKNGFNHLSKNL